MTKRLHSHFSLSCIGEGNGNLFQCFCLENPRDEGAWWLPSMGSHRVGHDYSDLAVAGTRYKKIKTQLPLLRCQTCTQRNQGVGQITQATPPPGPRGPILPLPHVYFLMAKWQMHWILVSDFFKTFIYLCIFGCVGSSSLLRLFCSCVQVLTAVVSLVSEYRL